MLSGDQIVSIIETVVLGAVGMTFVICDYLRERGNK